MRPRWCKEDEALFAAATDGRNGTRYHLTAERVPAEGGGWDWTIWRPGDAPEAACHGCEPSAEAALRAAEAAVRHWDRATPGTFE
jgi:hypothetical protein